jgi:hypothetical protein
MFKYYFGVRVDPRLETAGHVELDCMIEITEEDQKNIELAKDMVKNQIWKTTNKEALKSCNVEHLTAITMMQHRAFANNLSLHMIHTEFKLEEEDLKMWVDSCNHDKVAKQKLIDSKVGGVRHK